MKILLYNYSCVQKSVLNYARNRLNGAVKKERLKGRQINREKIPAVWRKRARSALLEERLQAQLGSLLLSVRLMAVKQQLCRDPPH